MKRVICIGLFLLVSFCLELKGQPLRILEQKEQLALVNEALHCIYNFEFKKADRIITRIGSMVEHHPVFPLLKSIKINWQEMPMSSDQKEYLEMKQNLYLTISLVNKMLKEDAESPEAVFFALTAHSMLAQLLAEEGSYFSAVKEAKNAYFYMKKGFLLTEDYPEFFFSTGLYNYYREAYPEMHPMYKSFMWFFASGDKALGLEQLKMAAQKATFTKMEANVFLAHIYLRYESKPEESLPYVDFLVKTYPNNLHYRTIFIESHLLSKKYKIAESHIEELLAMDNLYFRMAGEVSKAYLLENQQKDYGNAKKLYYKSLATGEQMERKAVNYRCVAYLGLGRIYEQEGNKSKSKEYYKLALDNARYHSVKQEAQQRLK
jgi:tetratricopeptide (TPR) repeat protein